MSEDKTPNHKVVVSVDINEPALLEAAFDRMRRECAYYGLRDIDGIYIHMSVEFSGPMHPRRLPHLDARLDQLWLGHVDKVEVYDPLERKPKVVRDD